MKQDEIIEMAKQAGIPFNKFGMVGCEDCEQDIDQNLVAFAKLVAAQATDTEREACAEICDDKHHTWRWDNESDSSSGPRDCAAAIRARGQT